MSANDEHDGVSERDEDGVLELHAPAEELARLPQHDDHDPEQSERRDGPGRVGQAVHPLGARFSP